MRHAVAARAFAHPTLTAAFSMAEQIHKKARTAASNSQRQDDSRFNLLSEAALENVVRKLSWKPRSDKWHTHFSSSQLATLLQMGGGVADATRSAFCELTLDGKFFRDIAENENKREQQVLMVLEALGDKLLRLDLEFLVNGVARTMTGHCTALRNLTLSIHCRDELASFSDFFEERGSLLEVLDIHILELTECGIAVLLNCTAVRRLKIGWHMLSAPLGPLWESIGSGLQDLAIASDTESFFLDLPVLGTRCRNATKIAFAGRLVHQYETVLNFLEDYGSALQAIDFKYWYAWNYLTPQQLIAMRKACPLAQIDYQESPMSLDSMLALGMSATRLYVDEDEDPYVYTGLGRVGFACPNLRFCHFVADDIPLRNFRALFDVPKYELEQFKVSLLSNNAAISDEVFSVLAEKVSSLHAFEYTGPAPAVHLWGAFVAANQRLEKVKLTFRTVDPCRCISLDGKISRCTTGWRPFVAPLLESRNCLEVLCNDNTTPDWKKFCHDCANMCLPVRTRKDTTITIAGCLYL